MGKLTTVQKERAKEPFSPLRQLSKRVLGAIMLNPTRVQPFCCKRDVNSTLVNNVCMTKTNYFKPLKENYRRLRQRYI